MTNNRKNHYCCSLTMLLLYLIMIISSCFYALSAPFLPPVFEGKHIRNEYVGIVFATFSIALIIFSPHVSWMIDSFGQPNLLGFALLLMGVSNILFGFVEGIEGQAMAIILALALRFI